MEEEKEQVGSEIGIDELRLGEEEEEEEKEEQVADDNAVKFLDSVDTYLTLFDSLSSTLRQGWLDLASARLSMGPSRLSTSLLDLKLHNASTSLHLTQQHEGQPRFTLRKWSPLDYFSDQSTKEDTLLGKSDIPELQKQGDSRLSEEEASPKQASAKVDDQVLKERSRLLSVFGTLVSPKLRSAQLSFETALETIVEIANTRSAMLSAFDKVRECAKEMR